MIEVEKLNSADKSKIKLEMKQVLVSYLAIGIIIAIVVTAAIILVHKSDKPPIEKGIAVNVLLLSVAFGFAAFLLYALKNYLIDLKSNSKSIYSGQITAKPINTNWGWHLNPIVDANSQPKLVIYFLVINNQKIRVEEDEYNRFVVGERVSLHFTTKSKMLLAVTKQLSSGNTAYE